MEALAVTASFCAGNGRFFATIRPCLSVDSNWLLRLTQINPHAPVLPFTALDIIRGPLQQIERDAKLMQGNRIFAQPNSFQNRNPLLDPLHEQIDLFGFEMVAYIHAASIFAFISPRLSRRRK